MTQDALCRYPIIIVLAKQTLLCATYWLSMKNARVERATDDAARRTLSTSTAAVGTDFPLAARSHRERLDA